MKKVLLIEDEMRFHKMFDEVFKQEGLELVSAYDGALGLKTAEEQIPDLIMLDLVLPKKSGFEVLKELKENPRLAAIPVIILTNLEESKNVEEALASGAYMYLVKANYSFDEILEKIKKILK
jgi:DNA-binding response OmpR family regulator